MNKTELVNAVAAKGLSKKDAELAVKAVFDSITDALANGEKVQLVGFGTFESRKRAARIGRNPHTKKEIKIPAGRQMYVDVKKTVVEKDNTPATITITYKDDSKMPLKLCYYTWNENAPGDINELAEHEFIINRKGTGKRLTKTIKLKDICLGNMEVLRSDFRVRAAGGDATVYSVNVSVPDGK